MEEQAIQTGQQADQYTCLIFPPAPTDPHITTTPRPETFYYHRPVNHNELSIMETEWKHIVKKASALSISKGFDIKNILLGALLPCIINNVSEGFTGNPINLWPTSICAVLYIVYEVCSTFFPCLKTDNTSENSVYLQDLKDTITDIEKRSHKKNET